MLPLSDSHPAGKFPLWVLIIITANLWLFLQEITATNPEAFIIQYAFIPVLFDPSNLTSWVPVFTSQFMHAGIIHIASNMWFLWVFGDNVEAKFGNLLFPIIYLLGGTAAVFAQMLINPDSQIPMLGASGAVAAVLGAYMSFFPKHTIKTLVPFFGFLTVINVPAQLMLIYWFFTQLFAGSLAVTTAQADIGGVAYFAHIGGFVTGWIVAKILK